MAEAHKQLLVDIFLMWSHRLRQASERTSTYYHEVGER